MTAPTVAALVARALFLASGQDDPHSVAITELATALQAQSARADREKARAAALVSEGWLYFNDDVGTEWSEQHPVESGECPDATDIRRGTAANLLPEMRSAWAMLSEREEEIGRLRDMLTPPKVAVAARYGFDGCGWQYIDAGSGSDWLTRYPDAEALTACRQDTAKLIAEAVAAEREACARIAWQFATKAVPPDGPRVAARLICDNIRARTTGGSDHGE